MSDLGSIINNPTLGYRLDPYEPGLLRQSKASQSTSQVVAHEHRNLTRLTRKAVQESRVIIGKTITYRPVIAGAYMGTAAGKTTVVSLEKHMPQSDALFEKPEKNKKLLSAPFNEDFNKDASIYPQSELEQKTLEELNQEELGLRVEIRRINSEMDESDRDAAKSDDKNPIIQPGNDSGQLKRELEEKKEELRKIHFAKMMKSQAELLGYLNEGLLNANKAPLNIVDAIYNGQGEGDDSLGQNIDLAI